MVKKIYKKTFEKMSYKELRNLNSKQLNQLAKLYKIHPCGVCEPYEDKDLIYLLRKKLSRKNTLSDSVRLLSKRRPHRRRRSTRRRSSKKKKGNSPPNSPVSDRINPYGFGGFAADSVPPHVASPKKKMSNKQLDEFLKREKKKESDIFKKPKSNIKKTSKKTSKKK